MEISSQQRTRLKGLPGVDHLLDMAAADVELAGIPRSVVLNSIRTVLSQLRSRIIENDHGLTDVDLPDAAVLEKVRRSARTAMTLNLKKVVNATGIVVHTNLGRSLLAPEVIENVGRISGHYSNLEYDLRLGKRGSRYTNVEDIICEISGAEAAMVVNNNAGAVLLSLETLARGRKVIVSRGELVEIGGSFRIPDVMAKSGGMLAEVGTTNRTHLRDYENAIDADTALLLKVHKSNYSVVGFSAEVPLKTLAALGKKHSLPVMEDLGSGTFIDFSRYGMLKEPTVQDSVAAGADIITFSGDKLLGGPQAGLIVGKKDYVDRIKKNPINRALRIDKMTLAALESTLRLYRDEAQAVRTIPTLRMMTQPIEEIEAKAGCLKSMLEKLGRPELKIQLLDLFSKPGGGSLPLLELPTKCLGATIEGLSANTLQKRLRASVPPVIGRIENDMFIMDARTVQDDDLAVIEKAFRHLLERI
jgi:L-seryl-tRNA(Ser) seleniumtransferase